MNDTDSGMLINFGSELKSLDDSGRIGGYLALFGGPADADPAGDYFTPETDFGRHIKSGLDLYYFHALPKVHGQPNPLEGRSIGEVEVKTDDKGLWIEGQMALRDAYEREVFNSIKARKQGLSAGAAPHLVKREPWSGMSRKVTRFPVVEASVTPTPADYRTNVRALKTLEWLQSEGETANNLKTSLGLLNEALLSRLSASPAETHQHIFDEYATVAGKVAEAVKSQGAGNDIAPLISQFGAGAPPESWVETCIRTASGLEQAGRRFPNAGPGKVTALKTLRDSLDGLLSAWSPKPAPDLSDYLRRADDLLSKLGAA